MAFEKGLLHSSAAAAADLSTHQYKFVKLDGSGGIVLASAAGENVLGILQNKPKLGETALVMLEGVSRLVAGAAVAEMASVSSSAAGKGITASLAIVNTVDAGSATDPVISSNVMAVALEAAAADLDIISVHLRASGALPTTAA